MIRLACPCCTCCNCLVKDTIFGEVYLTQNMFLIREQILSARFRNLGRVQQNIVIDIWRSLNSV